MIRAGVFVPMTPTEAGRIWRAVDEAGHPLTPEGLRAWMLAAAARPRGGLGVIRHALADPRTVETVGTLVNLARGLAKR